MTLQTASLEMKQLNQNKEWVYGLVTWWTRMWADSPLCGKKMTKEDSPKRMCSYTNIKYSAIFKKQQCTWTAHSASTTESQCFSDANNMTGFSHFLVSAYWRAWRGQRFAWLENPQLISVTALSFTWCLCTQYCIQPKRVSIEWASSSCSASVCHALQSLRRLHRRVHNTNWWTQTTAHMQCLYTWSSLANRVAQSDPPWLTYIWLIDHTNNDQQSECKTIIFSLYHLRFSMPNSIWHHSYFQIITATFITVKQTKSHSRKSHMEISWGTTIMDLQNALALTNCLRLASIL